MRFRAAFIFIVCVLVAGLATLDSSAQSVPAAFSPVEQIIPVTRAALPQPEARNVMYPRTRLAEVNLGVLAGARADGDIRLDLFDDVRLTARTRSVVSDAPGEYTWRADVVGVPLGWARFAIVDNVTFGRVVLPGAVYVVRYAGNGIHSIRQVNPAAFQLHDDALPIDTGAPSARLSEARKGMTFNYLGLFSKAAMKELGGKAAIKAMIKTTVDDWNDGAAAAGVDHEVKLKGVKKLKLKDQGNANADLVAVNDAINGTVDAQADSLRNKKKADFVGWYTKEGPDGACGLAWRPFQIAATNAAFMYHVVQSNCNDGIFGGAHELLHNMSGCHPSELGDCQGTSSTPFSFGFFINNAKNVPTPSAMTILGTFVPQICGVGGQACTMLLTMSAKKGQFQGNKVGNNKADIAKMVNQGAKTYADFR